MNHRQAVEYLPDYEAGSLNGDAEKAVERHVEGCSSCRDWLSTRDLLAGAMSREWDRGRDHPDSDLLALCVVRPEEIHEPDRDELREHLHSCPVCRHDLSSLQEAVREARPVEGKRVDLYRPSPWRLSGRSGLVAASLVAVLLGGGLVGLLGLFLDRIPPGDAHSDGASAHGSPPVASSEPMNELSGRDLEGTRLVRGDRRLVVSKLTVKRDAEITFHAGDSVAFGDGFRVEAGGRIRVGSRSGLSGDVGSEPDSGR